MAEPRGGEIIVTAARAAWTRGRWRALAMLALAGVAFVPAAGCAGRHRGPRSLAALGAVLIVGGSTTWVAGERRDERATSDVGFAVVAAGLVAAIAAGGWMAETIACKADPDCDESEQCREIPAPPGGVPYKQCVPR